MYRFFVMRMTQWTPQSNRDALAATNPTSLRYTHTSLRYTHKGEKKENPVSFFKLINSACFLWWTIKDKHISEACDVTQSLKRLRQFVCKVTWSALNLSMLAANCEHLFPGDGPGMRDYVTQMGILQPLLQLAASDVPVSFVIHLIHMEENWGVLLGKLFQYL